MVRRVVSQQIHTVGTFSQFSVDCMSNQHTQFHVHRSFRIRTNQHIVTVVEHPLFVFRSEQVQFQLLLAVDSPLLPLHSSGDGTDMFPNQTIRYPFSQNALHAYELAHLVVSLRNLTAWSNLQVKAKHKFSDPEQQKVVSGQQYYFLPKLHTVHIIFPLSLRVVATGSQQQIQIVIIKAESIVVRAAYRVVGCHNKIQFSSYISKFSTVTVLRNFNK